MSPVLTFVASAALVAAAAHAPEPRSEPAARPRSSAVSPADISVSLAQVGWLDGSGGYTQQFSPNGLINITLHPDDLANFFPHPAGGVYAWLNITTQVQGGQGLNWAVQNLALHVADPDDLNGSLGHTVFFNLTTPIGFPAQAASYSISLLPQPVPQMPAGVIVPNVPVVHADLIIGGLVSSDGELPAYQGHTGLESPPPPQNFIGAPPGTSNTDAQARIRIPDDQVEKIREGLSECAPAAIARSLKYLDSQHDTMALDPAQTVHEGLKDVMGTGGAVTGTKVEDTIAGKERYIREHPRAIGGKIDTDKVEPDEPDDAAKALAAGHDVEIRIFFGKDESNPDGVAHVAFVSDMKILRSPAGEITGYTVTTIDDPKQGDATAANTTRTYTFDAEGNMVGHGKPGAKCLGFITEAYKAKKKKGKQ